MDDDFDAGFDDAGFDDAGFDDAGFDDAGFDDAGFGTFEIETNNRRDDSTAFNVSAS
jgi:hypothetical protein